MSFDDRDKIILTIICSILGFIFLVLIISLFFWFIIRHYRRSKTKQKTSQDDNNHSPPISPYYRQQYQRSQNIPSAKFNINNNNNNNRKKRKRRRFNTNDSALTLSFDPPHLINQNVKNLEKLLNNESTLTANSWHYEETLPTKNYYHNKPSNEPVYASSSTVLTSLSNSAISSQQYHFLNELDHVLRLKQEEHRKNPLKYSQSCRQSKDLLPFDYYRSISPLSTITGTNSSNDNSLEPIYIRTNKHSNATLMRKVRLAQLRDDTAILY